MKLSANQLVCFMFRSNNNLGFFSLTISSFCDYKRLLSSQYVELTGTKEQKGRVRSEINNQNGTKLIIKRASIEINRTHCGGFYLGREGSFSGCGNRKGNFNRKKAVKEDDTGNTHFILQCSDCLPFINALGVYMKNILCKLIMKFTQLKKYGKQRIAPVR